MYNMGNSWRVKICVYCIHIYIPIYTLFILVCNTTIFPPGINYVKNSSISYGLSPGIDELGTAD